MEGQVNRIIFECVDEALSSFDSINKTFFYQYLRQEFGVEVGTGMNFEAIHQALKDVYGLKHYGIERKIVQILHNDAKTGKISHIDEIAAFGKMVEIFLQETEENLNKNRKFQTIAAFTKKLQREVEEAQAKVKEAERLVVIAQTAGMVGHDIRNPLQAITSDLYLIKDETQRMPDEESKRNIMESLQSMEENIEYINKIVTDLQDYTRQLKPNMQEIDLSKLVQSILNTVKIPEDVKRNLLIEEDFTLTSDPSYLRRIFTNIITNAIQAMPSGGELTIRASKNANIVIIVEDTGVGIPVSMESKMFKPLVTTKSKGQGLGLAVVKRFVDALNGGISFKSEEGNGTKFTIQLPILPEKTK
ncbi:MAG TPA: ATP-binding protein [Candidatus Limnocylindrales bacterium]|nr:ATP-binding protein [Candidatus Limnocylindrales bacterium]